MFSQVNDMRTLEKLERIVLKKAIEINGEKEKYCSQLYRDKYPPMSPSLCPWKETRISITKKNISTIDERPNRKKKARSKKKAVPYTKNIQYSQQYNVYPVQRPCYPTPAQFIFLDDEDFEYIQNDIFRGDSDYLFPLTYSRYIMSKCFKKWKDRTKFDFNTAKRGKFSSKNSKKPIKSTAEANIKARQIVDRIEEKKQKRIKPLNNDYDVSPISMEYYKEKPLKTTKASERLFQSSLNSYQIGDFNDDPIWNKIKNW